MTIQKILSQSALLHKMVLPGGNFEQFRGDFGKKYLIPRGLVISFVTGSCYNERVAGVAELADALDLGSSGETHAGSIPVARIFKKRLKGAFKNSVPAIFTALFPSDYVDRANPCPYIVLPDAPIHRGIRRLTVRT